jgi:hypothetical protein
MINSAEEGKKKPETENVGPGYGLMFFGIAA